MKTLLSNDPPTPWKGETKIPWHEPGFSGRMLREHLSQQHDHASRRFEVIDRHVAWLHASVLEGRPSRILDLGCGPGFYSARLAELGHTCTGIDFSPASIEYAQAEAERRGHAIDYRLGDILEIDLGTDYQAVLMTFGEFNTFQPEQAQRLLDKARAALAPNGVLVLEAHNQSFIEEIGRAAPTWFSAERSLFSDEPHICLKDAFWYASEMVAVERYAVIDINTNNVTRYTSTTQAYSDQRYREMLQSSGFEDVQRYASLSGDTAEAEEGLHVLVGR